MSGEDIGVQIIDQQAALIDLLASFTNNIEIITDAVQQAALETWKLARRTSLTTQEIKFFMEGAALSSMARDIKASNPTAALREAFTVYALAAQQESEFGRDEIRTKLERINPLYARIYRGIQEGYSLAEIVEITFLKPAELMRHLWRLGQEVLHLTGRIDETGGNHFDQP